MQPPASHPARPSRSPASLLPLGALAAGFGLCGGAAIAQGDERGATAPPAEQRVLITGRRETDANSLRATSSAIGKGIQDLRDIPQSVTVLTQKLLEDRRLDTVKEALHQTAGISFLAAEGGEEDIRLRGFSMATSGDVYIDGLRDPAFYERDTFAYERVELLRGSASMLFGRGSTGGVVNQVSKQAWLGDDGGEAQFTAGSGRFGRASLDLNHRLGEHSALRANAMVTDAENHGNRINKQGLALNLRSGIGQPHEFSLQAYHLRNDSGAPYGLPWLRADADQGSANPSGILGGIDPRNCYAAASDYNAGGVSHIGGSHRWRIGEGELKTTLRSARYDRDMRASALRFCVAPTCPGFGTPGASGSTRLTDATPLNRGTNNKVQDLHTRQLQSDFSRRLQAHGMAHELLAGLDLSQEDFRGYATVTPAGVVLDKNAVRATLGSPNDGSGWVNEGLRIKRLQSRFEARALGVYAQDLVALAPTWKLLAGLRYDRFSGRYRSFSTTESAATPVPGTVTAERSRSDGLWSRRFGLLWQPSERASFHLSYGTSFNTSGDTYQYDLPGSNTPPEGSRNIELGARLTHFDGRLSSRFALFHSTKTHERNRDSPAGTPLADYLLSGRRHAAGIEADLAGRITPRWEVFGSYAWIPVARIDQGNADGSTLSGEQVGERPSLTPRHSGSLWSTWQLTPSWRAGVGLNTRSSQTPNRNPAGIVAPSFVTADLMAEVRVADAHTLKLNVSNLANKHYADSLYSGHYIPGAPRTLQLTLKSEF